MDFTDLEEKRENTKKSSVTTPGPFPPPPPPPPPSPALGSTTSRTDNSSSTNFLFKDQVPNRNYKTLAERIENKLTKLH